MNKLFKVVLMIALAVALTAGTVLAGPYVGVQGGASFNSTSNTTFEGYKLPNAKVDTSGAIGAFGGFDFNDARYNFPAWAKYLGVEGQYLWNGFNYNGNNIKGNQNSLAVLGVVKYPLMVNKDYPRGRVFPYVGVGPALLFTSVSNVNSTNVALVVEPGVRAMITPKVSAKVAYQFRYGQPNLNGLKFNAFNNMLLCGVAYHF